MKPYQAAGAGQAIDVSCLRKRVRTFPEDSLGCVYTLRHALEPNDDT